MRTKILLTAVWALALMAGCNQAQNTTPGTPKVPEAVPVKTITETSESPKTGPEKAKIEVVFVLDTTGSMGGLIEGAKLKIWAIANEIIKAKPTPELKIGLVAYRDIGDAYVTKVFDLSDDIDEVYKNLLSFHADGGGDTPESVNRALNDAITQIKWSVDKSTFRLIYLVGDSPPHMDYNDGLDYRRIVQSGLEKDITVNTVRCGGNPETEKIWQEIARLADGNYVSVSQTGSMVAINTPMDKELAELSRKLGDTSIGYGKRQKLNADMKVAYETAVSSAPSVPAARAGYMADKSEIDEWDLIDSIKNNRVKLEDVKDNDLPEEMKKMTVEERKKYIEQKEKERDEIRSKMNELNKKRADYIAEELKKRGGDKDSFDSTVVKNLKEQAARKGIRF